MNEVTELTVMDYTCLCPHCGAEEYGFCGDARGSVVTCDSCDKGYKIHPDAEFEMI